MLDKLYTSAETEGKQVQITKGSSFLFREMFHEDHVIPVSIMKELVDLNPTSENEIKELLEKMHMCVIMKDEDRKISTTKGRSLDFDETIINVYNKSDIFLVK